ncbi:MAG: hypothetical protein JWQ07_409 [Ramlibacter sp.]|nr:hypothetical protein [Ramlibacter sp.]
MAEQIGELAIVEQRGCNLAAALTREQLEYALAIAATVPGKATDTVLIASILQAIATNYTTCGRMHR